MFTVAADFLLPVGHSLRLALNRYLSLFSQVFFSHFDSAFALTLNPGVPQALSRYGARAGINLWSPLLNTRGAS